MTLSKPGLHGDLSPAGSSCQNHSRGAGGQAAGRLSHPLLSHRCLTFLLTPPSPAFMTWPESGGMVGGGGWGENQNQRFLSQGESRMLWPCRTLTSPGSTRHGTEAVLLGQVAQCWALETKQRARRIWSLPLRGSQSTEGSKADPKPGDHTQGDGGVSRGALGDSGSTVRASHPALVGGTVALQRPAHAGVNNMCRLNDRAVTGLSPIGESRSSSGVAHLQTPPQTTLLP